MLLGFQAFQRLRSSLGILAHDRHADIRPGRRHRREHRLHRDPRIREGMRCTPELTGSVRERGCDHVHDAPLDALSPERTDALLGILRDNVGIPLWPVHAETKDVHVRVSQDVCGSCQPRCVPAGLDANTLRDSGHPMTNVGGTVWMFGKRTHMGTQATKNPPGAGGNRLLGVDAGGGAHERDRIPHVVKPAEVAYEPFHPEAEPAMWDAPVAAKVQEPFVV